MYTEDDLLPLSGLQHLAFCERQWALIHLEQQWEENPLTAEGRLLHEHVHEAGAETRRTLAIVRALPLRCLRLGISGQADAVEFHLLGASAGPGATLPGREGSWRPFPVEYKRGRPKRQECDLVQVCAQALCLEEMLGAPVPDGAIFYATPRRRLDVAMTAELRARTEALCVRMQELYVTRTTSPPVVTKACQSCSLNTTCCPNLRRSQGVAEYLATALED
jgi:CRISPR-associated exonuclease Cas4